MFSDWRFFAFSSAGFAALTAIFAKLGLSSINSNLATFLRTIVILLFCALIITFRKEWKLPTELDHKALRYLLLSGLATGCSWLCYFRALQLEDAAKVAPLEKVSVAFTILLAVFVLGEAASWKTIVGGLLVVAGSVLIAL